MNRKFKTVCVPGYWLSTTKQRRLSYFGGRSGIKCPNCRHGIMLQLAVLQVSELPRNCPKPANVETIKLLTCLRCRLNNTFSTYRLVRGGNKIEMLDYLHGKMIKEDVSRSPAVLHMSPITFRKISKREQLLVKMMILHGNIDKMTNNEYIATNLLFPEARRRDLLGSKHQLGGFPDLLQGFSVLKCPLCGRQMPFFASISGRGTYYDVGTQAVYYICCKCAVLKTRVDMD